MNISSIIARGRWFNVLLRAALLSSRTLTILHFQIPRIKAIVEFLLAFRMPNETMLNIPEVEELRLELVYVCRRYSL
ncbi:hypothetical protein V8C42DRAFT_333425 [Trichoderma barbatum]